MARDLQKQFRCLVNFFCEKLCKLFLSSFPVLVAELIYLAVSSACTPDSSPHADHRTWILSVIFNLFWDHASLFQRDGIYPNNHGSQMLSANFQHAVQSPLHACLHTSLPLQSLHLMLLSYFRTSSPELAPSTVLPLH